MSVDVPNLRVISYPAPELRVVGEPITAVDETVRAVAHRMIELTNEAKGIGLAAQQVGLPWRMFVTVGTPDAAGPDRVYVNPRLSGFEGGFESRDEGCLSLPGVTLAIRRPRGTTITAHDLDGNEFTLHGDDMLARVWQHEFDHLNGVLIIDKASTIDRLALRKVLKDLEAAATLVR